MLPPSPARGQTLASLLLVGAVACADSVDHPSLGETGDEDEQDVPLPGGQDCDANWYDIDGAPVPLAFEGARSDERVPRRHSRTHRVHGPRE